MTIKGKLFGLAGPSAQNAAPPDRNAEVRDLPSWHARQMARLYEASRRVIVSA